MPRFQFSLEISPFSLSCLAPAIKPDPEPSIAFRVSAVPFLGERARPASEPQPYAINPSKRRSEITVQGLSTATGDSLWSLSGTSNSWSCHLPTFYGIYVMGFRYRWIPSASIKLKSGLRSFSLLSLRHLSSSRCIPLHPSGLGVRAGRSPTRSRVWTAGDKTRAISRFTRAELDQPSGRGCLLLAWPACERSDSPSTSSVL